MECYSCSNLLKKKKISPGPTIYTGKYWVIEHAHTLSLKGWIVFVLKRHVEALHELTKEEFLELATLQEKATKALFHQLQCEKEYVACFSEKEHFYHIHFHVIPRASTLPSALRGTAIFSFLKEGAQEIYTKKEIAAFCVQLQKYFN